MSRFLSLVLLVGMALSMSGCQAQKQMQQQLVDMDTKLQLSERHIKDLTADLAKNKYDLDQMRILLKQTAQSVVDLQKAEEDRAREALEAKQKAEAAKTAKPAGKKPLPKKKKK